MPNDKGQAGAGTAHRDANKGQNQLHDVHNPDTGEKRQITQAQWRGRKSDPALAGFKRTDGVEDDEPTTPGGM
jgi:hypothetical protein